jgi:hypothetical protein
MEGILGEKDLMSRAYNPHFFFRKVENSIPIREHQI